jgi:glycopeptide antibiotics resistance protein
VRRALALVFVGYLVVLAILVLDPSQQAPGQSLSLVSGILQAIGAPVPADSPFLEVASNVALFIPLGLLGLLLWPSRGIVGWTGIGALLSAVVELSQLLFLPHRFATVNDVVANSAGALLGAVAVTVIRRVRVRRQPLPPRQTAQLPD